MAESARSHWFAPCAGGPRARRARGIPWYGIGGLSIHLLPALLVALAAAGTRANPPAETPGGQPPGVSFVNDVLPVLSKVGCNQGTCHGAASGKGGFKLSLRGFAPELDYAAISRAMLGRRINRLEPQASLLLAKPSLAVPHQGGRVLAPESAGHQILLEWLRQGAPGPAGDEPYLAALDIVAVNASLEPGQHVQLRVAARFSNGQVRDATPWARYDTNDSSVLTVDAAGVVRAAAPGKAAASAAYQHLVSAVELTIPYPATFEEGDYASLPRHNYIDERIIDQWQKLRLWPAPRADDATFLRRIHLDIAGTLPEADEVRAFLADPDPRKREAAIDRLLESPEYVDLWVQRWGDVFRVSREWLGEKGVWTFHAYLRRQVARNAPWDQVVRELVAGAGDSSQEGPPNFYRLQKVFNEAELWPLTAAETTAQTFLGMRTQCARCHNHPFDRWTQADYYGMASFFAQVASKTTGEGNVVIYDQPAGEIQHPRLGRPLPPKTLGGPAMASPALAANQTRRQFLASWIASPDNPFFARAAANRIWRYFMGRGLVEPVDDLRQSNPATDEALLDALARDLVGHGFDLKHLMRTILNSRAYQLSSTPTGENRADCRFYSYYRPKRLGAEQILDALGQVTGRREKFPGLPEGFRAQQLPDTKVESKFLDMFGRPLRRVASCECERVHEPNVGQALELMNSRTLHERVTAEGSLVDRLVRAGMPEGVLVDEVYLRSLGRPPAAEESAAVIAAWTRASAEAPPDRQALVRREFFEDLLWAMLNTKEFLFNH